MPSSRDASTKDRIVVAAGRGELSYLVINSLAREFDVAHVVFERRRLWRLLRFRVRRLGVPTVARQLAFMLWDRAVITRRSKRRIEHLLRGHDVRPPDGRIPTTDVASVNDPGFASLLEELQPKVVVVSGTGIIARRVLERGPTFLNIHCGITPRYRGVHGAFWAVVEGRPEEAGTTVHVIDPGVDTGPVVGQQRIEIDPTGDTYRSLVVKQHLAGLDLLRSAVAAALDGSLRAVEPDATDSRQWFSPTPADHRRFKRQMRALSSRRD
jgi:folate-dependent phosphoribosylglycinamide formyltransferase PurN